MANLGRNEKVPYESSINLFMEYLRKNPIVTSVNRVSTQVVKIEREDRSDLRVHMTNLYVVSEADVMEILVNDPSINVIVTMSEWNSYSQNAENYCAERNVGLFKFREFMGAVYHDGERFINYVPPKTDPSRPRRYGTDRGR